MEQPNHKQCATCEVKADTGIKLSQCSGPCVLDEKPLYCSEQCQNSDWKRHRPFCRRPKKKSGVPAQNIIPPVNYSNAGGVHWVGSTTEEDASLRVPIVCGAVSCTFGCDSDGARNILKIQPLPKFDRKIIEIKESQTGGLGVFACRDIKYGELLFAERPLIVNPAGGLLFYVSEDGRMLDAREMMLQMALSEMTPDNQRAYRSLANSHQKDDAGTLSGIFRTNAFMINLPKPRTDASRTDASRKDEKLQYAVVGNKASRLNHSCSPNALFGFSLDSFSIQFHALKDIKKGEEIFCSYIDLHQTAEERQAALSRYGFECACRSCKSATEASDRFRKDFGAKIGALYYKAVLSFEHSSLKSTEKLLASGLQLQAQMQDEGLDVMEGSYYLLLKTIALLYARLGYSDEQERYYDVCEIWEERAKVVQSEITQFQPMLAAHGYPSREAHQ